MPMPRLFFPWARVDILPSLLLLTMVSFDIMPPEPRDSAAFAYDRGCLYAPWRQCAEHVRARYAIAYSSYSFIMISPDFHFITIPLLHFRYAFHYCSLRFSFHIRYCCYCLFHTDAYAVAYWYEEHTYVLLCAARCGYCEHMPRFVSRRGCLCHARAAASDITRLCLRVTARLIIFCLRADIDAPPIYLRYFIFAPHILVVCHFVRLMLFIGFWYYLFDAAQRCLRWYAALMRHFPSLPCRRFFSLLRFLPLLMPAIFCFYRYYTFTPDFHLFRYFLLAVPAECADKDYLRRYFTMLMPLIIFHAASPPRLIDYFFILSFFLHAAILYYVSRYTSRCYVLRCWATERWLIMMLLFYLILYARDYDVC